MKTYGYFDKVILKFVQNPIVLTSSLLENDGGLFDAVAESFTMEDEIKFFIEYLQIHQPDELMLKNLQILLSWLSSKHISLRFEYDLPEMIMIHDQTLQFQSITKNDSPNYFQIEYLTTGTRAHIATSDLFEMNDSKNADFYDALRHNEIVSIECNKILETDDISITIEITAEQKVLRLIRIDKCIRHNQLNALKSHVRKQ